MHSKIFGLSQCCVTENKKHFAVNWTVAQKSVLEMWWRFLSVVWTLRSVRWPRLHVSDLHMFASPCRWILGTLSVQTRFAFSPASQCKSCWVTACERGIQAQFILFFIAGHDVRSHKRAFMGWSVVKNVFLCNKQTAVSSNRPSVASVPFMWLQHRNAFLPQLAWRMLGNHLFLWWAQVLRVELYDQTCMRDFPEYLIWIWNFFGLLVSSFLCLLFLRLLSAVNDQKRWWCDHKLQKNFRLNDIINYKCQFSRRNSSSAERLTVARICCLFYVSHDCKLSIFGFLNLA